MYENSQELARACPHVPLSRPTPPDNTEWFNHREQRLIEPAKVVLCFDCQQPIEPGKGVQEQRCLCATNCDAYAPQRETPIPTVAIVHPACNLKFWDHK